MKFLLSQFAITRPMGRLSYLFHILVVKIMAALFIWMWFNAGLPFYDYWMIPTILVLAFVIILAYCYTVRRLNDINQIGIVWGLLILVPILGTLLLIVPLLLFRGTSSRI